jgi:hypothetical protein
MLAERREQATAIWIRSTGNGRSLIIQWKAAAFVRRHEPYESRGSRTDLREARGEIPRAYSAFATVPFGSALKRRKFNAAQSRSGLDWIGFDMRC